MSKTNRVSKSEEDFLKEFEAELAGEDLDAFWNNFTQPAIEPEVLSQLGNTPSFFCIFSPFVTAILPC